MKPFKPARGAARDVAKLLGQSALSLTARYAHLGRSDLHDAVGGLERWIARKPKWVSLKDVPVSFATVWRRSEAR
jgi:hypothetical protein